ncbi:hypothetical protein [Hydrogenothermus marinus]|uniref:Uncharacterized protein n=1 Tax=Hydrogenothermus marinus TaxID=133270 RepID=A0A3M0BF00_9AQUI|nr:hypothetical protein [Hydrogenothermus marinus]RMA95993.1 hypothetical protein CLV39_1004 [Hydrogenothermus marinus]
MKFSQLILGFILLYLSILGLYAAFTSEPRNWVIVLVGVFLLLLALVYILTDLTNYSKYIKDNILDVDAEAKSFFREITAILIVGFSMFILYKFYNGFGFLAFVLLFILAATYAYRPPIPGIYKNGKFLGKVYKASLKVNKDITLNKPTYTEEAVRLKIVKNGQEVAKLHLTPEGVMELTPDKIKEVFPDIDGKVERFNNIFKVGDYFLYYEFIKSEPDFYYEEDDEKDTKTDPAYSYLIYNIWHK